MNVDLPAFGNPTNPTSANTFNSNSKFNRVLFSPGFENLGAGFLFVLNLALIYSIASSY